MGKKKPWKVEGLDTFEAGSGEDAYYPVGEFPSESEARDAARNELKSLEKEQPSYKSGGQGFAGIQDQVYITDPDGNRRRFCE